MHAAADPEPYDVVVIGSGFGGAMAAYPLVRGGARVLMLERGDWVERGPHNWEPDGAMELTPSYSTDTRYRVFADRWNRTIGGYHCVGGQSVFSGAVSLRFREADFESNREITADSGACWPYDYSTLEPYYAQAERILNVAGESGRDPTEPFRSSPYPQALPALSETSRMIETAARALSLEPFRLPLAINYLPNGGKHQCIACTTCDAFACAVEAKNDIATCVLPDLIQRGLQIRTNTVATRLLAHDDRIWGVECRDKLTGHVLTYRARVFILAAGVLASPHLLRASRLEHLNPGGHTIGRYLMRHCNALIYGFFPTDPNPRRQFHKQLGIHDFYFGDAPSGHARGKLGNIQQVMSPPVGLIRARVPSTLHRFLDPAVNRVTGLLAMAEDQPQALNGVAVDWSMVDPVGLPGLTITHCYSERDRSARRALVRQAKAVLRKAGARFSFVHPIDTFSHAVGTVRMGRDATSSALDEFCQFRGLKNLYVSDGSFMPTSAAVNPSLTISANALRVGEHILQRLG